MNAKAETAPNPREAIGGNMPPLPALISAAAETEDFSVAVTTWLNERFGSAPQTVQALLDECAALLRDPATGDLLEIKDDEVKGKVASLIKRLRDEVKKLDGLHDKEKIAYQRGGQAVDQFFFGLIDRLARRDKKNRPGAADVLAQKLTDYDTRKLAEEQERRRQESVRLAREAEERRQQEEATRLAAEEAAAAAERARKPEHIEAKTAIADEQRENVVAAAAETAAAETAAADARIATLAKPADIMRQRVGDGTLTTMGTEAYAEVVDRTKLDYAKLGPYFPIAAVETALRGWAKSTGHTVTMDGATIGKRPKSVVR